MGWVNDLKPSAPYPHIIAVCPTWKELLEAHSILKQWYPDAHNDGIRECKCNFGQLNRDCRAAKRGNKSLAEWYPEYCASQGGPDIARAARFRAELQQERSEKEQQQLSRQPLSVIEQILLRALDRVGAQVYDVLTDEDRAVLRACKNPGLFAKGVAHRVLPEK